MKETPVFVNKRTEYANLCQSIPEIGGASALLYSAMIYEVLRLRRSWRVEKIKKSQNFILECYRELSKIQEKEYQGNG